MNHYIVHLDKDEAAIAAILRVLLHDGMTSGARSSKRVENEVARACCDLDYALDEPTRLRCIECRLHAEDRLHFFARFVGVSNLIVRPPCPGDETIHIRKITDYSRDSVAISTKVDAPLQFKFEIFTFYCRPATTFGWAMNLSIRRNDFIHLIWAIPLSRHRYRLPSPFWIVIGIFVNRSLFLVDREQIANLL